MHTSRSKSLSRATTTSAGWDERELLSGASITREPQEHYTCPQGPGTSGRRDIFSTALVEALRASLMICRWDRRRSDRAEGWVQRGGAECSADRSRKLRRHTRGGSKEKREGARDAPRRVRTRVGENSSERSLASRLRLSLECSQAAQLQNLHPQRSTPIDPLPDLTRPQSRRRRDIARANTAQTPLVLASITLPCSSTSPETGGERADTSRMADSVQLPLQRAHSQRCFTASLAPSRQGDLAPRHQNQVRIRVPFASTSFILTRSHRAEPGKRHARRFRPSPPRQRVVACPSRPSFSPTAYAKSTVQRFRL